MKATVSWDKYAKFCKASSLMRQKLPVDGADRKDQNGDNPSNPVRNQCGQEGRMVPQATEKPNDMIQYIYCAKSNEAVITARETSAVTLADIVRIDFPALDDEIFKELFGCSEAWAENAMREARTLQAFTGARFWEDITPAQAKAWIEQPNLRNAKPRSQGSQRNRGHILRLCSEAAERLESTHWLEIWIRATRPNPKPFTREEFSAMMSVPGDSPRDRAEKVILSLGADAGLRANEMCLLRVEDINLKGHFARTCGKHNTRRMTVFGLTTVGLIEAYLEVRVTALAANNLLLNSAGRPLNRLAIYRAVKRRAEAAGVKDAYPHRLRHTFATDLMEGGADLADIQRLMGHQEMSTTEAYTAVRPDHLKEQFARFHPRSAEGAL